MPDDQEIADSLEPAPETPVAQETVAPEADELEETREPEEGEPEELEEAEEGDELDTPVLEAIDVEIDGVTYSVPKALEDGYLRHADYSKKTLEVAEVRKAVDAERARVQEYARVVHEDIQEHAQINNIDAQLAEYDTVDWNALRADDPDEFALHSKQLSDLRYARDQVAGALSAKGQQRASIAAANAAKQKEITRAALERDLPNFGPGLERDLTTFATNHGVTPQDIGWAMENNANMVKILNKAYRYDQLVMKQKAASKANASPAEPAVKVSGRKAAKFNAAPSDSDSTDVWMKKREQQLAKRAAS